MCRIDSVFTYSGVIVVGFVDVDQSHLSVVQANKNCADNFNHFERTKKAKSELLLVISGDRMIYHFDEIASFKVVPSAICVMAAFVYKKLVPLMLLDFFFDQAQIGKDGIVMRRLHIHLHWRHRLLAKHCLAG